MKPMNPLCSLSIALACGMLSIQAADTVYVSATAPTGGDGSTNAPFNTINKAINETQAKTVIVLPGLYREAVKIPRNITLLAPYGPNYTHISSPGIGIECLPSIFDVTVQGLMISAGDAGVWTDFNWSGNLVLYCMVIQNAGSHGIHIGDNGNSKWRFLLLDNSVIHNVKGQGINLNEGRQWMRIRNSTITKCVQNAINAIFTWSGYDSAGNWDTLVEYSNISNNGRDFSGNASTYIKRGDGMIGIADPKWMGGDNLDQSKLDFRLMPNSPLRDIGHPLMSYNDPDNSRNDIGAFGGPYSLGFYENPVQGPLILGVTVDNPYVPRGAKIAIRAKTSVYK